MLKKDLTAFAALLIVITVVASASAQTPELLGSWQSKDPAVDIRVTFEPDGTGTLDGAPIKYTASGTRLTVNDSGTINNYIFKINGNQMVVSGGNLNSPLTFVRITSSPGGFVRPNPSRPSTPDKTPKSGGLVGRWQSSEATVQINEDGTLILNGSPFRYAVKGSTITIGNDDGVMQFPFELSGDTLNVQVEGRTVVYKRLSGEAAESAGSGGGSNPAELFGKWCYMSNVNSTGGGRMSNRCFTLYPNGTYDYYSETSSSGPVASSASQESDSGTWSVSGGTLTAQSRSRGTLVFPLEKRNHPKTGDPMLVLDGDAFVTYSPRQPW
jgi:hypothetical protein